MALSPSNSIVTFGNESMKSEETNINSEVSSTELKSMRVTSNIRNRYARTVVTSKYFNPGNRAQQTTFSIILPDSAFISGFIMEIKGKQYEAYVKEKEQAKQDYEQAVSQGIAAAHVAMSARDSNNFTVSVNVEPQSDVTFILTYEELLVRKHSKYEMIINLHPGQFIDDLGVDVYINESRPIVHVETPAIRSGNEITNETTKNELSVIEKTEQGVYHVSFYPTIEQQKQMADVLKEQNSKTEEDSTEKETIGIAGQFVIEYEVERDPKGGEVLMNDGYFVHFFAPTELKPIPKHVIFVLDVSGSMAGTKLKQVKEAMLVILGQLNPNDYFNIVQFSTNVSVLKNNYSWDEIKNPSESKLPQSFRANKDNIKKIQNIIKSLKDDCATNISDALIVALRLTSKGILHLNETDNTHKPQPIIVFLTDGQPNEGISDPKKIIEIVNSKNDCDNKSVIFTLAFGDDADNDFLKELAIKNSGFARKIYKAADASLQLQDFYKQISCPLLTNVTFKYPEQVQDISKKEFDVLFDGSEFVVVGKIDEMLDDFVFVEAATLEGTNQFRPNIQKQEYGNLERLWAYMTIKQLLDKKYEKENKDENSDNTIIEDSDEKQALKLALQYSFVTPLTSLVVVKPDEKPDIQDLTSSTNDELENHSEGGGIRYLSANYCMMESDTYEYSPDQYFKCASKSLKKTKLKGKISVFGMMASASRRMGSVITSSLSQMFTKGNKIKSRITIREVTGYDPLEQIRIITDDNNTEAGLKSIDMNCSINNHILNVKETRKYVNFKKTPQTFTFDLFLPDDVIVTNLIMKINCEDNIFQGKNQQDATREYEFGLAKILNTCLAEIESANKIKINLFIVPQSTIYLEIYYEKYLVKKMDKYRIDLNLNIETIIEKLGVNIKLNEKSKIHNIYTPYIISEHHSIVIERSIIKSNDNEAEIKYEAEDVELKNQLSALNASKHFFGKFILEYETENEKTVEDKQEESCTNAILHQYLIAVENTK